MAIQVSGTQVIGNSRELTNIASIDATTAAAIGAAGVGGSPTFLASPPNFASPTTTYSSSGTYSRGSTSSSQMLWIYLVAGGNGGGCVTLRLREPPDVWMAMTIPRTVPANLPPHGEGEGQGRGSGSG